MGNSKEGLRIHANILIDSGCKAEIAKDPEEGKCRVRHCCGEKGLGLCFERPEVPCDLLEINLELAKLHCIENFKEEGIEH